MQNINLNKQLLASNGVLLSSFDDLAHLAKIFSTFEEYYKSSSEQIKREACKLLHEYSKKISMQVLEPIEDIN